MTPAERQQSLTAARRAAHFLGKYIASQIETATLREEITCLLAEFTRLDAGEQKRNEAGAKQRRLNAQYGHLGGRPRGKTKKRGKK
jgi:hypothetical protein